jgi:hypothetical protein
VKARKLMEDGEADIEASNPVLIKCWDWNRNGESEIIGEFQTTLAVIRNANNTKFDLTNAETGKKSGVITIVKTKAAASKAAKEGKQINMTRMPTSRSFAAKKTNLKL